VLELPNWHPFLVHFPVALFSSAVLCDVALIVRYRYSWLDRATLMLYCGATLSSIATAVSGKLAANRLLPEAGPEAVELIGRHGDWAFLTVVIFFVATLARFDSWWRDRANERPRAHRFRLAALVLALIGEVALLVTASRGGAAVYRHGVGVEMHGHAGSLIRARDPSGKYALEWVFQRGNT
jgi:uncharacterized membrane protein